jgi:hypothetical protein
MRCGPCALSENRVRPPRFDGSAGFARPNRLSPSFAQIPINPYTRTEDKETYCVQRRRFVSRSCSRNRFPTREAKRASRRPQSGWGLSRVSRSRITAHHASVPRYRRRSLDRRKSEGTGEGVFLSPKQRRISFDDLANQLETAMRLAERKSLRTAVVQMKHSRRSFSGEAALRVTSRRLRDYQQLRRSQGAAKATVDREILERKDPSGS